jgi:hypothetical protein
MSAINNARIAPMEPCHRPVPTDQKKGWGFESLRARTLETSVYLRLRESAS